MSQASSLAFRVAALCKSYRQGPERIAVLRELNLDAERGEFVALMGPSGSGKSTLLHLIGGLDRPDAGSIEVGGVRLNALSEAALSRWRAHRVGFVFQFYHLIASLSAARNVEVPLLLTPLKRAARRRHVEAALGLVGLADRSQHPPPALSVNRRL